MTRPRWRPTTDQIEQVRKRFPTTKTCVLAAEFGVAYHQVASLAHGLRLLKDPVWLAGPDGGRAGTDSRGMGTRFQPGHATWTKGRTLPGFGDPRTWFKKGFKPKNWKPVGALRLASCGYLQIKLTDTGYPSRDWVMYHRHIWQTKVGPIPQGNLVVFRGDRLLKAEQITTDVLECISKAEHMRRHTFHQYGPEIAGLVILRGAITRQINNRSKETE